MRGEKELRKTLALLDWFERIPCPEMTHEEELALATAVGMLRWVLNQPHEGAEITDELIRGVERFRRDAVAELN